MPTTINTIEDLIQLLDDNPQWVQALRARLLIRELIELPESFAKFVRETNQRFDRIDTEMQVLKSDVQVLKGDIKSIRDDMAPLKDAHARNAARREADLIAEDMGFVMLRVLSRNNIRTLVHSSDVSGISKDELRSFRRADCIIEATGPQGDVCYIAVEASFTVNGRDTTRAVRNAAFLTGFTGKSAYAAVAGARMDERVRGGVESGGVFWYQLEPHSLEAE